MMNAAGDQLGVNADPDFESLCAAVRASDTALARQLVHGILERVDSDDADRSKLKPHKAHRAESFEVTDDGVTFTIERHPGYSVLEHTQQTWLMPPSGVAQLWSERECDVTDADILRVARRHAGSSADFWRHVDAAWFYADQWARREMDYDPDHWNERAARAWVMLAATDGIDRPWRGTQKHFMCCNTDTADCLGPEWRRDVARQVVPIARTVWNRIRKAATSRRGKQP